MKYKIEEIATLTGARLYGPATGHEIEWLLTDSRSLVYAATSLFFAIKTPSGDGHDFIPELYSRGVRSFVVTALPKEAAERFPEANFLLVPSALKALQRLAERHREQFNIPVIGITGSNGKTMVKEWTARLLAPSMVVTRSPLSYNSQIGVPLSVWNLNARSQVGIFEAGISKPGEMEALHDIIQPTIGVMVSLGSAHAENFESPEAKCREKMKLFEDCDTLVFCADDALIARCVTVGKVGRRLLYWSRHNTSAPLYVKSVEPAANGSGTNITYVYRGEEGSYSLPFADEASVNDSVHCLAVALLMGISREEIAERMAKLEPVAMRMEVSQGTRGYTIINDAYNSDVNSLDIALDFLARRASASGGETVVVLSSILQSGMEAEELYAEVARMVNSRRPSRLVGIGREISRFADLFSVKAEFFPTTEAFIAAGEAEKFPQGATILLKGARQFEFEKIYDLLTQKVHETTLYVNLDAIVRNLNHYRSFMNHGVKMVCMVKASAYGCGATEVARTLQEHGVDYLAVAVADEGVTLREAGITANIMVMNPEMTAFRTMLHYHLEPEVYSFRVLEALEREAGREGITHYPIHLKIDTGMHRLGFEPEEIDELVALLKAQDALAPRSVFSHFVGSDGSEFNDFTRQQFEIFDTASSKIQKAFPHKILRHICNTAGIERFKEYHLDMVRLGLGLYGIDPYTNKTINTVATLRTTILQIHNLAAGETVGYSRKGVLKRNSRIAAIPIGYADGLSRHLGCGRGYCLVGGKRAPYVGNICMDVAMIDVTDIPCKEGDSVEIFGDNLPVTAISDELQTIPYEILTSVSERVKRVYYKD